LNIFSIQDKRVPIAVGIIIGVGVGIGIGIDPDPDSDSDPDTDGMMGGAHPTIGSHRRPVVGIAHHWAVHEPLLHGPDFLRFTNRPYPAGPNRLKLPISATVVAATINDTPRRL
jgi:hypothetical protein